MYVYMYVCVCMYVCMYYLCMYVCMYVCMCVLCMYYVCMHACMYVCVYVLCMYVSLQSTGTGSDRLATPLPLCTYLVCSLIEMRIIHHPSSCAAHCIFHFGFCICIAHKHSGVLVSSAPLPRDGEVPDSSVCPDKRSWWLTVHIGEVPLHCPPSLKLLFSYLVPRYRFDSWYIKLVTVTLDVPYWIQLMFQSN